MLNGKKLVLFADDDPVTRLLFEKMVEECGFDLRVAQNGEEAWALVQELSADLDVVLLDWKMPKLSGLEIVHRMIADKSKRHIPIIMQTVSAGAEEIREALDAGVFYYLTKPVSPSVFKSVLQAAMREAEQRRVFVDEFHDYEAGLSFMNLAIFRFRDLKEAESLAFLLSRCFPDPSRVVVGLAELFVNAVEHGNCGVSYEEKGRLVDAGTWREEVDRRVKLLENSAKSVEVSYRSDDKGFFVSVRDQGEGFEWKKYLQIDPARANDNHGRGIAQANLISFDRLTFNDKGNEVSAFVSRVKPIEW